MLADEVVFVRAKVLREAMQSGRYREVSAGDGGATRVRLMPVEESRQLSSYRIDRRAEGVAG